MGSGAYSAWQATAMSEHSGDFPTANVIAKTVHLRRINPAQRSPDGVTVTDLAGSGLRSELLPTTPRLFRLLTPRTHNPTGGNHLLTAEGKGVAEIFRRLGTEKVIQVGEVATI